MNKTRDTVRPNISEISHTLQKEFQKALWTSRSSDPFLSGRSNPNPEVAIRELEDNGRRFIVAAIEAVPTSSRTIETYGFIDDVLARHLGSGPIKSLALEAIG